MRIIKIQTNYGQMEIYNEPDECPFCHKSIVPIIYNGILNKDMIHVLMSCPNQECLMSFLSYYLQSGGLHYFKNTSVGIPKAREFPETIQLISKSFIEIYNQAYVSEQFALLEICGSGYRKSLEYLIKDYLILENPDSEEIIKKTLLGNCINDFVKDSKVKSAAKRAVWLGNDETHYQRKWEGKNLIDLKRLIDLTIHWIEMEALTKNIEIDMPD